VGIPSRKENSVAAIREVPNNMAAMMVEADRELPGNTAATTWASPTTMAINQLIFSCG